MLQQRINPPELNKSEVNTPGNVLRAGDKVMQIRNNYEKEVFNGDIGRIVYINGRNVTVDYPERADGEYVTYTPNEIDELQLAYAMSVHKSQGSEYPTGYFADGSRALYHAAAEFAVYSSNACTAEGYFSRNESGGTDCGG